MKTLTVKLADGATESRKTDRSYTHAIVVVITEEHRKLVLGKIENKIADHEAVLAENTPLVNLPAQIAAYEAATARLSFLGAEVTEENLRNDGTAYTFSCARWLSRSYRNEVGTEDERRRGRIDSHGNFYGDTASLHMREATAALLATARGKVEASTAQLACDREWHVREDERVTVGRAFVHGWSQSPKNALKAEQAARDAHPGARVYTTTEISVHVPKARKQSA